MVSIGPMTGKVPLAAGVRYEVRKPRLAIHPAVQDGVAGKFAARCVLCRRWQRSCTETAAWA